MAEGNNSTAAPGVRHVDLGWGTRYEGSRFALVASGLVAEHWLPTLTERNKAGRVVRTFCTVHDGRKVKCHNYGKGKFSVTYYRTKEEVRLQNEQQQPAKRKPARITLAPAVTGESLTVAELHHIRLLRTVTEDDRNILGRMLAEIAQERAADRRPFLQLVSNNREPSDG